jgi:16S rRNA (guanine(527)-N(7))-methyltransferase RsmG
MHCNHELLVEGAGRLGLTLTEEQLRQFDLYAKRLLDYNEKVNLTAITDPDGIAVKHFTDSIAPLAFVGIQPGAALVDVGTGAGFPAVPMKIIRPDLRLTLMDSQQKRLAFLQSLGGALGQEYALVHMRAEQAGAQSAYRERYDMAVARAVAQLRVLAEYCLPLVRTGGQCIALKGADCAEELETARKAIELLGGQVEAVHRYRLIGELGRTAVVIRKISQTPSKYPRQRTNLAEKPL